MAMEESQHTKKERKRNYHRVWNLLHGEEETKNRDDQQRYWTKGNFEVSKQGDQRSERARGNFKP
ncbi:Nucleolar protein 4 [Sesbania bispinosa]|nr:Nucleolar protein 4 [Sesbania bispinosa]